MPIYFPQTSLYQKPLPHSKELLLCNMHDMNAYTRFSEWNVAIILVKLIYWCFKYMDKFTFIIKRKWMSPFKLIDFFFKSTREYLQGNRRRRRQLKCKLCKEKVWIFEIACYTLYSHGAFLNLFPSLRSSILAINCNPFKCSVWSEFRAFQRGLDVLMIPLSD